MAKIATTQIKKEASSKKTSSRNEQDEIARLAYQFYVERGYQNGSDQEDWLRAEKIVKARKYNS